MLLCNADNELIKLINDILNNKICLNINNTWQMIVLSIIIISVVVKFSKAFYASDIELFLSKGSIEKKKVLSNFILLFVVIAFCNELFISQINFIFCEFILAVFVVVYYAILCIQIWHKKRKQEDITKKEQRRQSCNLFFIIVIIPVLISGISMVSHKSEISLAILGTLAETILIFLASNGFRKDYSNIKIVNNKNQEYYLLVKIDDKRIICGDKKTINDSSKLIIIDVENILNGTYYMVPVKESE